MKKESPNMGTKTSCPHVTVGIDKVAVKKESPNMGTKTFHSWFGKQAHPYSREKRIPKHGDEEKTCVVLIVGETDYP